MSRPSSSASLPPYSRNESSFALLSRRGSETSQFGSHYVQVDDGGVYLSSLVVTVLVSAAAIVGILLFTLVITLSVMLGSCQSEPVALSAISPFKSGSVEPVALSAISPFKSGIGERVALSAISPSKSGIACDSFILNAEVNNLQGWILSKQCINVVAAYMTGGQYFIDFAGAIVAAAAYLNSLPVKGDGSEVVVMDIDETVLSNLPYYVIHNYGAEIFNEHVWNEWVDQKAALPLHASVAFFNELKRANIGVVFLTGRPETQRNATSANLIAAGYEGWAELMLRSPSEVGLLAVDYKSKRRLQLEQEGYHVLTCLGDQWSDLMGPASGTRTFKLPNPMYYLF